MENAQHKTVGQPEIETANINTVWVLGWNFLRCTKNSIENPKGSMEKFKVGGEITLIFMLFQTVFLHISNPSGLEPIYFRKIPFYREIPHKVQTIVSGPLKAFYLLFHSIFCPTLLELPR